MILETQWIDHELVDKIVAIFPIISLNIYFKSKIISKSKNSIIDNFFNYAVLAFTGSIVTGNPSELQNWRH